MYRIWYRNIVNERPKGWVLHPEKFGMYHNAQKRIMVLNAWWSGRYQHITRCEGVNPNFEDKFRLDTQDTPESPQEAFWYVFCPSKGKPTVKHKSRSEALTEAHRLSRANLGVEFFVCKAENRVIHTQQIHVKESNYV